MEKPFITMVLSIVFVLLGVASQSSAHGKWYNDSEGCPKKFLTEKHLGLKPFVITDATVNTILTTNLHYSDFEDRRTGYTCAKLLTTGGEPILMFWAESPQDGEDPKKPPHYVWLRGENGIQYKAMWFVKDIPYPLSTSFIIESTHTTDYFNYSGFKIVGIRFTLSLEYGGTAVREHFFANK